MKKKKQPDEQLEKVAEDLTNKVLERVYDRLQEKSPDLLMDFNEKG